MKTLLLRDRTFLRIGDRLDEFRDQLRPVMMDDEGAFVAPWGGAPVEAPKPDIAFGNGDVWFQRKAKVFVEAMLAAPRLQWFQSSAAGVENPMLTSIGRKAEIYTTCHDQAEAMAEWALWAALDFLREGPAHRASFAEASWEPVRSREIMGSRWLIVGFGSIGKAIGRRIRALGGHVTGVRRSGGDAQEADAITTSVRADDLAAADIVVLCAPHTRETESMANAAFFAAMRSDAMIMNLGRGALVSETDLVAGLDAGRPAFAILDVTSVEPLPAESPLWAHPKAMVTPHDSSMTLGTIARTDAVFLDNLERFLAGQPLRNVAPVESFV